ncbi:MAG TPA: glycoside hydrolase family 15 protein [Micromonosporaceae bacterium]
MTGPRTAGYAPLASYAAIGDGRTLALVAEDGSIDWLALPDLDSPSVFGALLDPDAGQFSLAPVAAHTATRRYLPGTNLLETTFATASGTARVVDALTVPGSGLAPARELVRRIEGVDGEVPMRWRVRPRFGYGLAGTRIARRLGVPVATAGSDALAVLSFDAGQPEIGAGEITGDLVARPGSAGLVVLSAADGEPLVLPARAEVEARLSATADLWRDWAARLTYRGRYTDTVTRSALALRLLVYAPSGALAAAGTTSLPEQIGGERNWDYRYSWIRDSALALSAFLRLGCAPEARAYFWWLMQASQLTHPKLRVLYRLDGGARAVERTLPLSGYRDSRPVRAGNDAAGQTQLDTYGELMRTAWLYANGCGHIDVDVGRRLAGIADLVCELWHQPDHGIWEVRGERRHFTQSKMMCAITLDLAVALAGRGVIPDRRMRWWRDEADAVREFVETRCFDPRRGTYLRSAGSTDLDAAVLLALLHGYGDARSPRWAGTVDAIRADLASAAYVRRYSGDDGLEGTEGAFVACTFWLVEALALTGRRSEAARLFDQALALGNDVGLYAEEVDPGTGEQLGNLPQALSHLALISAATTIDAHPEPVVSPTVGRAAPGRSR